VIIAQISDTHIALDTPDCAQRIQDFEDTIADINALDPAPDVIIHTGDIVQNGRMDEYAVTAGILAKAKAPTYLMVGNKDDRANLRASFPTADYLDANREFIAYSIEDYPVRMVALDTLNPGSNKGDFCQDRIADLIAMLDQDVTRPVVVFAHHPPFIVPVGPDPLHFETDEVMQQFRAALGHSSHLLNIYCGHVHRGTAGFVEEVPVLVMPCIATTLRRGDYPEDLQTCPLYHIHSYQAEWGFSSEIRFVRKK